MNANDYLAKDLLASATASARARGHALRPWIGESRFVFVTDCRRCGKEVVVNVTPQANEIHIGGEAVALNCKSQSEAMGSGVFA